MKNYHALAPTCAGTKGCKGHSAGSQSPVQNLASTLLTPTKSLLAAYESFQLRPQLREIEKAKRGNTNNSNNGSQKKTPATKSTDTAKKPKAKKSKK